MKLLIYNNSLHIQCHLQPNRMPTNETTLDTDRFCTIKKGYGPLERRSVTETEANETKKCYRSTKSTSSTTVVIEEVCVKIIQRTVNFILQISICQYNIIMYYDPKRSYRYITLPNHLRYKSFFLSADENTCNKSTRALLFHYCPIMPCT